MIGAHKNEIIIAGHHISKTPCLGAVNELFGNAVDSVKVCDCTLPNYYKIIKNDPERVKKFEEDGIPLLDRGGRDNSGNLFKDCIIANILDTTYKRLDRNVTINEYFSKSYYDTDSLNEILNSCVKKSILKK